MTKDMKMKALAIAWQTAITILSTVVFAAVEVVFFKNSKDLMIAVWFYFGAILFQVMKVAELRGTSAPKYIILRHWIYLVVLFITPLYFVR